MTIVAWDGNQLAVDSKRVTYSKNRKTGIRVKKSETIDIDKITLFGEMVDGWEDQLRLLFRDQVILAVGRCGSVRTTLMMLDAMKNAWDLEAHLQDLMEEKEPEIVYKPGSLFILTQTSTWVVRFSSERGFTVRENGDKKFAMGTKSMIANFLMRHLGIDAMHAAAAVTLSSTKCGGVINSVKRHEQYPFARQLWQFPTDDRRNVRLLLKQFIALEIMAANKPKKRKDVKLIG